jgi:AcrR family transcriptional regulator
LSSRIPAGIHFDKKVVEMRKEIIEESVVDSSRDKLILSAEVLFAEHGFNGVSVRDIANAAGVNSALVGYYFGGKEGLLSEVYTRHCEPLIRERTRLLAEARASEGGLTLEKVIAAFIAPSLEVTTDKNGRTGFTRLRAILSAENSALLEQLVAQNFDASSRMVIDALGKCLPGLSREEIYWRFHFLLGTIYYTGAGPQRVRILSEGRCDPSDAKATTKHLVPFLAAGFRAPGLRKTSRSAAKKSKPAKRAARTRTA